MFNGIWLVASTPVLIRGREVPPGERFELPRTQAGAWLVTGRATMADDQSPAPKRRRRYRRRDLEAEA